MTVFDCRLRVDAAVVLVDPPCQRRSIRATDRCTPPNEKTSGRPIRIKAFISVQSLQQARIARYLEDFSKDFILTFGFQTRARIFAEIVQTAENETIANVL